MTYATTLSPLHALADAKRADASLARFIARYEAMTGKPFRDPAPTEAEIAAARQRADDAVRGLIGGLSL